jgi:amino acid transporter
MDAVTPRNKFGTFSGVFTPSILTILGVIMFMRANFVTGQAGILGAIAILVIAKLITFATSLSIAAISTNMQVRGGGAYYMISRVLGPEFGGAIGIALFLALTLSVPFYFLGFVEALCCSYPQCAPYFQAIGLVAALVFFLISWVGAGWALKAQVGIMVVLVLSIVAFLGGAAVNFSAETFAANWGSLDLAEASVQALQAEKPELFKGLKALGFMALFAIYFPAVTGVATGVNMSGDLKDPTTSIPRGTFAAVAVGFLVYLAQILLCGGAFDRMTLITEPYAVLQDRALLGMGLFVMLGVFAATLSSALGSYLSAPRVLQAVSRDPVLTFLRPFAKGTVKGDEPRRALILVGIATVIVLVISGNGEGGGALNAIASVVTMFFLYTYGMINFAAFIEAFGKNPSFRPRFRYFHWMTALLGTIGCVGVAFAINVGAAAAAIVVIGALYWYVRTQQLKATFGDARRGFVYTAARNRLLQLAEMPEDLRNWRPTVLVFSGNPASREALVSHAVWMESGRGIVILANVLQGTVEEHGRLRETAVRQLREWCREKNIQAFPMAIVAESIGTGVEMLLQTAAIGPIRPNVTAFGWTVSPEGAQAMLTHLRLAAAMNMCLAVIKASDRCVLPAPRKRKRIDLWWRGQRNGAAMLMLAYLMSCNWEWARTTIRILRMVPKEAGREPAREALQQLLDTARVEAETLVLVDDRPFAEVLHEHSRDASCLFLGFELPEADPTCEVTWHALYERFLEGMPTAVLVHSRHTEELLA